MPPPLESTTTGLLPEQHGVVPDHAALAIAVASGVAGALSEPAAGMLIHVAMPTLFGACLARHGLSQLRSATLHKADKDFEDVRRGVRVASRHVYLLLYGVIGVKYVQLLLSPRSDLPTGEAMHSLWPYLAGGLFCLVLVRCRALRIQSRER